MDTDSNIVNSILCVLSVCVLVWLWQSFTKENFTMVKKLGPPNPPKYWSERDTTFWEPHTYYHQGFDTATPKIARFPRGESPGNTCGNVDYGQEKCCKFGKEGFDE